MMMMMMMVMAVIMTEEAHVVSLSKVGAPIRLRGLKLLGLHWWAYLAQTCWPGCGTTRI